MSTQKDRIKAMLDVTAQIVRHNPKLNILDITYGVQELAKLAKTLHGRYTNACNHAWASGDVYEKRTAKLEAKAIGLGDGLGIKIECQRDPRGTPLILKFGNIETRLG